MSTVCKYIGIVCMFIGLYLIACVAVAYWMIHCGWKFEDNKLLFHCFTAVPSIVLFVLCICEEVHHDVINYYKRELND